MGGGARHHGRARLLGPRIWHSRSWQRARRSAGPGIFDEIYRPAVYEQQLAAQSEAEAGDSVDLREPKRRRPPLT